MGQPRSDLARDLIARTTLISLATGLQPATTLRPVRTNTATFGTGHGWRASAPCRNWTIAQCLCPVHSGLHQQLTSPIYVGRAGIGRPRYEALGQSANAALPRARGRGKQTGSTDNNLRERAAVHRRRWPGVRCIPTWRSQGFMATSVLAGRIAAARGAKRSLAAVGLVHLSERLDLQSAGQALRFACICASHISRCGTWQCTARARARSSPRLSIADDSGRMRPAINSGA